MTTNMAAGDGTDKVECQQKAESRQKLEKWLNKSMRIKMTDGRTLVGIFVCTDCDCNIIMGSCEEYLKPLDSTPKEDPRILGLAMVPGKHVVSIEIDESLSNDEESKSTTRNNSNDTVSSFQEGDLPLTVADSDTPHKNPNPEDGDGIS